VYELAVKALSFPVLLAAFLALGGCGSGSSPAAPVDGGAGDDASTDGSTQDSLATAYPAFKVDAPQIRKNQGKVLASPVIVTVTWPGDPNASTWEAFGDALGASTYWSATTSEYGVGPSTSGPSNHVRMTQPLPATLAYSDLQNLVLNTLQGMQSDAGAPDGGAPNPAWPQPTFDASGDAQTIYSLFIPATTTVPDPGDNISLCTEGGLGYHDNTVLGGKPVAYSVTLECNSQTLPDLEETAAHEMVEAATNPYVESSTLGYEGFDVPHYAWDLYAGFGAGDELADACQNWWDAYFQETGSFPYWVQASWSNAAALAGHDPCVPQPTGPYEGMTLLPSQTSTVTVPAVASLMLTATQTQGFKVTVGQPLSFQVGYFSDAPTSAPWKIAYDFPKDMSISFTSLGNGTATVAIDKTSGQNGDVANVTVTVKTKGAGGFHVMAITWDPPAGSSVYGPHYLPLVLVDQ